MSNRLNLGVVYKDEKIVNHRSIIKVFLNPFLRFFGINIATIFDIERNKLLRPTIVKCNKIKNISFLYDSSGCTIKKERILF